MTGYLFTTDAHGDIQPAIEACADNADKVCEDFRERAASFVLDYLAKHGPTPGEEVTDAAIASGIVPHDARAFGAVYMGLSRRKLIVKAGTCQRRKGHGTNGANIWALSKTT